MDANRPTAKDMIDAAFLSGYIEVFVAHHRGENFAPTLQDLDLLEAAAKLLMASARRDATDSEGDKS